MSQHDEFDTCDRRDLIAGERLCLRPGVVLPEPTEAQKAQVAAEVAALEADLPF